MLEGHVAVSAARGSPAFLVDVHASDSSTFLTHLNRYKLRSDVSIEDVSGQLCVAAALPQCLPQLSESVPSMQPDSLGLPVSPHPSRPVTKHDYALTLQRMVTVIGDSGAAFSDARCATAIGARCFAPADKIDDMSRTLDATLADEIVYTTFRMFLGLPEGYAQVALLASHVS